MALILVVLVLVRVRVGRLRQPVRWDPDRMVLVVRVGRRHQGSDAGLSDARAVVRLGGRLEMGHRSSHQVFPGAPAAVFSACRRSG